MLTKVIGQFAALATLLACFGASAATIDSATIVEPADATNVLKFSKLEILVSLSNLPAGLKPFESDPASGGIDFGASFQSPSAKTIEVNGFFDGTGWRVRFSPDETGVWSFTIRATDSN